MIAVDAVLQTPHICRPREMPRDEISISKASLKKLSWIGPYDVVMWAVAEH